jgi:hypothetical protein
VAHGQDDPATAGMPMNIPAGNRPSCESLGQRRTIGHHNASIQNANEHTRPDYFFVYPL